VHELLPERDITLSGTTRHPRANETNKRGRPGRGSRRRPSPARPTSRPTRRARYPVMANASRREPGHRARLELATLEPVQAPGYPDPAVRRQLASCSSPRRGFLPLRPSWHGPAVRSAGRGGASRGSRNAASCRCEARRSRPAPARAHAGGRPARCGGGHIVFQRQVRGHPGRGPGTARAAGRTDDADRGPADTVAPSDLPALPRAPRRQRARSRRPARARPPRPPILRKPPARAPKRANAPRRRQRCNSYTARPLQRCRHNRTSWYCRHQRRSSPRQFGRSPAFAGSGAARLTRRSVGVPTKPLRPLTRGGSLRSRFAKFRKRGPNPRDRQRRRGATGTRLRYRARRANSPCRCRSATDRDHVTFAAAARGMRAPQPLSRASHAPIGRASCPPRLRSSAPKKIGGATDLRHHLRRRNPPATHRSVIPDPTSRGGSLRDRAAICWRVKERRKGLPGGGRKAASYAYVFTAISVPSCARNIQKNPKKQGFFACSG